MKINVVLKYFIDFIILKRTFHLKHGGRVIRDAKGIFAPKKLCFKAAEYQRNDSGVVTVLPEKVKGCYWSLDGNTTDLTTGENRLHFGFLNQTFTLDFALEKGKTFGFVHLFSDSKIKIENATKN